MGVREDAADARQAELIGVVRDGMITQASVIAGLTADKEALTTERDALRTALEEANASTAAQIDAAVLVDREQESDADAARQETWNSSLEEIADMVPPAAPSPEPPDDSNEPTGDSTSSDAQPSN